MSSSLSALPSGQEAVSVESTPAAAQQVLFRSGSLSSEEPEAACPCKASEKGSEAAAEEEEEQRLGLKTYIKPEEGLKG